VLELALPLGRLVLQLGLIFVCARLFGALARRARQPAVIGEIAAGIALGPSLLGSLWPGAPALLFPAASLPALRLLGQLGVILFLFSIGQHLSLDKLRLRARTAVFVSQAGILLPFLLGLAIAVPLYERYAPPAARLSAFGLFMGVAMSITAFPVLARIVEDQGLLGTSLGATALACAAVDDVTAWILLAGVVALVTSGGGALVLLQILAATGAFVLAMLFVVRPLLARALALRRDGPLGMLLVLGVLAASSAATEWAGLHALFGAFMAGAIMPREEAAEPRWLDRLLAVSGLVLLPVFFVSTGLRTEVARLRDPQAALACLAIITVATLGKLGGGFLAARWTGMSTRDSVVLGTLMNTRGLVELVVLDVGFRLGLLGPEVFTMMVLMALVTTALAGPVVRYLRFTAESELESTRAAANPRAT